MPKKKTPTKPDGTRLRAPRHIEAKRAAARERRYSASGRRSTRCHLATDIDPLKPYKWVKRKKPSDREGYSLEEKERAITHICHCLAQGEVTLSVITHCMVPRLPKTTLAGWRAANPEWDERIDEAFEVGCDKAQMRNLEDAKATTPEKANCTRLVMQARKQMLEVWNTRYRNRQLLGQDPDSKPLYPGSSLVLQGVTPGDAQALQIMGEEIDADDIETDG